MGDVLRKLPIVAFGTLLALSVATFDNVAQAAGSKSAAGKSAPNKSQAPAKDGDGDQDGGDGKKTAELVQQAYDAGIKAYNSGHFDEAQRALEAAMRGGLPSSQMPRAL
jgi:TolA-binding protein